MLNLYLFFEKYLQGHLTLTNEVPILMSVASIITQFIFWLGNALWFFYFIHKSSANIVQIHKFSIIPNKKTPPRSAMAGRFTLRFNLQENRIVYAGRRIRLITPCKRSAARGGKTSLTFLQLRPELNFGVRGGEGCISIPRAAACTRLFTFKTFGLI